MSKIRHPDFAIRMQQACDGNPKVPLPNYGRLGWFVDQIKANSGAEVTIETIRKWFAGESRPRQKLMASLAQVLEVDEAWLSLGRQPKISRKQAEIRDAAADGAVNYVAGLIQMCGGHPAFPDENTRYDLSAIIRGAQYFFHIVVAADGTFSVPITAKDAIVIGLIKVTDLHYDLFELDWEGMSERGKRKGSHLEVPQYGWKQIKTFSERF